MMLNRSELLKLASIHSGVCVSIYLPTHRKGREVLEAQDRLVLKNEIQHLQRKLPSSGMAPSEVNAFLEPIVRLLDDADFWRHQSDGLAIFRTNGVFKKFLLPIHFEERFEISSEFYLLPLLPYVLDDRQYFLMSLSLRGVALYRASQYDLEEITPAALNDMQFEDFEDKEFEPGGLQYRSQSSANHHSRAHSHKERGEYRKESITKYFRQVDQIIKSTLDQTDQPLVLAGLDYLIPLYRKINTITNLAEEHISCNPDDHEIEQVRKKSWHLVRARLNSDREKFIQWYASEFDTPSVGSDIGSILAAALDGRIDSLLLVDGYDVWGTYDPASATLKLRESRNLPNVSLVNRLAISCLQKGSRILPLTKEEMPFDFVEVGAIYQR